MKHKYPLIFLIVLLSIDLITPVTAPPKKKPPKDDEIPEGDGYTDIPLPIGDTSLGITCIMFFCIMGFGYILLTLEDTESI